MRDVNELIGRMRAGGQRVTPQRLGIVRQLVGNTTHPTVEAIHDAVRAEMPTVSRKTVYQTVHDLEALGEVRLLDLGTGSVRVDPNVDVAHHHLVCSGCGSVRDVAPVVTIEVADRDRRDFTIDAIDVIVRGRCRSCRT